MAIESASKSIQEDKKKCFKKKEHVKLNDYGQDGEERRQSNGKEIDEL